MDWFASVKNGIDQMEDDQLLSKVFIQLVHPLLPLNQRNVSKRIKKRDDRSVERLWHSAFMSQPMLLDTKAWTGILASKQDYVIGPKHNGIRVWLIMTRVSEDWATDDHQHDWILKYGKLLPCGRFGMTMMIDRAGHLWTMYSHHVECNNRLWQNPTMIEGELMESPNVGSGSGYGSTLVLFDLICIGGHPQLVNKMNLNVRSDAIQILAERIQIRDVYLEAKVWTPITAFFDQPLSVIQKTLSNNQGSLANDGWIIVNKYMPNIDIYGTCRIFKYKPNHTIDMWVYDVGDCQSNQARIMKLRADDDYFVSTSMNSDMYRSIQMIESCLGSNTNDIICIPWESKWNDKFSSSSSESTCMLNCPMDQTYHQSSPTVSHLRQWLMDRVNADNSLAILQMSDISARPLFIKPILVEFEFVHRKTIDSSIVVFDLLPIGIRKDKLYANAGSVVASTCMSSIESKLSINSKLTPIMLKATIKLSS